jgi:hypothetical protein
VTAKWLDRLSRRRDERRALRGDTPEKLAARPAREPEVVPIWMCAGTVGRESRPGPRARGQS